MRTKKHIAILLTACLAFSGLSGITAFAGDAGKGLRDKPPAGYTVTMFQSQIPDKYTVYHQSSNPGLPANFQKHSGTAQFYKTDPYDWPVYCTEVHNAVLEAKPEEFDEPDRDYSSEQKGLLKYIIAHGPRTISKRNEAVLDRQAAVQLVVWLVCENKHNDGDALDAVLFPASGDFPDDYAYAQTLTIGRIGRAMLEAAKANYTSNWENFTAPSFASDDKGSIPEYKMTLDADKQKYVVELTDTNGRIGEEWNSGFIWAKESGGMDISVDGNAMKVSCALDARSKSADIQLGAKFPSGKLVYLRNSAAGHESYQRMARFVNTDEAEKTLYLKVTADEDNGGGTEPPGGGTDPPGGGTDPPGGGTDPPGGSTDPPGGGTDPPGGGTDPPGGGTDPPGGGTDPPGGGTEPPGGGTKPPISVKTPPSIDFPDIPGIVKDVPKKKGEIPRTGDMTQVYLLLLIVFIAAIAIVGAVVLYRRNRMKEKEENEEKYSYNYYADNEE